jgi:hypothetical protein
VISPGRGKKTANEGWKFNRKRSLLAVLLVLAGIFFFSRYSIRFSSRVEEKKAVEKAIETFHAQMNSGELDEIYNATDEVLQKSQSREAFGAVMRDTQKQLGQFKHADFSRINVFIGAPTQIRAVYNSTFEWGETTELFTFIDRTGIGAVKLLHYQVSPGAIKPTKR